MKYVALVFSILAVVLGGCVTFQSDFERQAKAKGWDRAQTLAARYEAYRILCLKKEADGSYVPNYACLPKEEVIKQLEKSLSGLEDLLGYKNVEANRFMNEFGLRDQLIRQEFILKAMLARVLADENNLKFKEFIGEMDSSISKNSIGRDSQKGFDQRALTVIDLQEAYPFKSKAIEDARAAGLLKEVGRVMNLVSRDFDKKEPDPDDPTDQNKFVWTSKKMAYELVQYKVMTPGEQPQNNTPNYIEVWRLVDGKRESFPAVKAFLDGAGKAILVLDTDKENEKIGFGLPNVVEQISEKDLYGEALIARVFPDLKKNNRIEPKAPPIRVEIVRVGTPVDPWEVCTETDGCRVPTSFRKEPVRSNYNVRFQLKAEKKKDSSEMTLSIGHVAKEWTDGKSEYSWSSGKVVEYYKPKSYCADSALLSAQVLYFENKKKIRIVCRDGTETDRIVTPTANVVIEEKPFQVAFTIGETRWLVWDSDGDGKFDKRRKISPSIKYDIGIYSATPDVEGAASGSQESEAVPEQLGGPE